MIYLQNSLLFSILNRGNGDRFVQIARELGATGATVFPAKGTASSTLLHMLGIGDKSKDVVMIILSEDIAEKIIEKATEDEKINGVSAIISPYEEGSMKKGFKLITIIVNSGFADDIMDTARKAGATGGTITHARGTATGDQASFMGITVVPEKEMVMILSEEKDADNIVNAISEMKCLEEPGVGVVFVQDVKKFVNLGAEK